MKTFEVRFRYQDRSTGAVESTSTVDASSLPGAVAKATREFVKALDRKQRLDIEQKWPRNHGQARELIRGCAGGNLQGSLRRLKIHG